MRCGQGLASMADAVARAAANGDALWLIKLPGGVEPKALDGLDVPIGPASVEIPSNAGQRFVVRLQPPSSTQASASAKSRVVISRSNKDDELAPGPSFTRQFEVSARPAVPRPSLDGALVNRKPVIVQPDNLNFVLTPFGSKKPLLAGTSKPTSSTSSKLSKAGKSSVADGKLKKKKTKKEKKAKKEKKSSKNK